MIGTGNGPHDLLAGIFRPVLDKFRDAAKRPAEAQAARLQEILSANADTEYGKRFGFASIKDVATYRARVPRIDFDAISAEVDRMAAGEGNVLVAEPVERFVKTSGTTGASKHIPITRSLSREMRDAQMVWIVNMLRENKMHANGTKLVLVSPASSEATSAGIPVGANTGRMQGELPWFARFDTAPAAAILAIRNPDVRAYLTAVAAAAADAGSITATNPSTLWLLARRLTEWREPIATILQEGWVPSHTPDGVEIPGGWRWVHRKLFKPRPKRAARLRAAAAVPGRLFPALWPRLTAVNTWRGGAASFWLERLAPELGGLPVRDVGFAASEGFFGVPLESGTAFGVPVCAGPVMEFDPVGGGATVGVEALEEGREYELFVTTCGGLYRYAMRDIVRAGPRWENVPTIAFTRKTGSFLSVTGEKVSDVQVLAAAADAARAIGFPLAAAGASIEMSAPPAYVLLAEPVSSPAAGGAATREADPAAARSAIGLATEFDRALCAANVEYAGKRADGRLAPALARVVAPGSFEAKRRARVAAGGPDAQVKTPVLFPEGFDA